MAGGLTAARLVGIVGPTASGKSALAMAVAARFGGEIVSCDSLQVYRGLDVGSAKPTPEDRAAVPHHLLDVVDPDQPFSAADYARLAREALYGIRGRGGLPVVVGGTGLYLRALLSGIFEGPSRDEELRARLEAMAERWGDARLHRLLRSVDPEGAERIPPRDRVRVVRALEVFRATGRPLVRHHGSGERPLAGFEVRLFGIAPGRDALREAVARRTGEMLAHGLVDEVLSLLRRYPAPLRPLQAIGYRQAAQVARGELPEAQAQRDIVAATMRYAKRQMTWFRHQAAVDWFASPAAAEAAIAGWLLETERRR